VFTFTRGIYRNVFRLVLFRPTVRRSESTLRPPLRILNSPVGLRDTPGGFNPSGFRVKVNPNSLAYQASTVPGDSPLQRFVPRVPCATRLRARCGERWRPGTRPARPPTTSGAQSAAADRRRPKRPRIGW